MIGIGKTFESTNKKDGVFPGRGAFVLEHVGAHIVSGERAEDAGCTFPMDAIDARTDAQRREVCKFMRCICA